MRQLQEKHSTVRNKSSAPKAAIFDFLKFPLHRNVSRFRRVVRIVTKLRYPSQARGTRGGEELGAESKVGKVALCSDGLGAVATTMSSIVAYSCQYSCCDRCLQLPRLLPTVATTVAYSCHYKCMCACVCM